MKCERHLAQRVVQQVVLTAIFFGGVRGASAQSSQPAPADAGGVAVLTRLPPKLTAEAMSRAFDILEMSEAQRKQGSDWYFEYGQVYDGIMANESSEFGRLNAEVIAHRQYDSEGLRRYEAFYAKERSLTKRLVDAENEFFSKIKAIIAPSQEQAFQRAEWLIQRLRCSWMGKEVRSSRIDVSEAVRALQLKPDTAEAIDEILFQYEAAITPLFLELEERLAGSSIEVIRIQVKHMSDSLGKLLPKGGEESRGRALSARSERARILLPAARLQRRAAELNRVFVDQIAALLPQREALQLRTVFLSEAYPPVYPDYEYPVEVMKNVAASLTIPPANREAATTIFGTFRSEYDQISKRMETAVEDWQEQMARTLATAGFDDYRSRMVALRAQRWEATTRTLRQVRTLVETHDPALLKMVEEAINMIDRAARMNDADTYPGT